MMLHISVPVGQTTRIHPPQKNVTWASDNPDVLVRTGRDGVCRIQPRADRLGAAGQALITGRSGGVEVASYNATVVNWPTNERLELIDIVGAYTNLIDVDGVVYAFNGRQVVSTTDSFETVTEVGEANITVGSYPILRTPYGYICRNSSATGAVYRSDDLLNWELLFTPAMRGLYHCLDWYWDDEKVYVYLTEYSADGQENDRNHRVYRGIIHADGKQEWETVLEFYSVNQFQGDPTLVPSARHCHVVAVDQYTGDVWVGTGDAADQCNLLRSTDHGETWSLIGTGVGMGDVPSQKWRTLSIWFTEDYVYWNNDTSAPQSIWRIARPNLGAQSPENDLSEEVIRIDAGSHWYHCWARDNEGKSVVIMGQAPEGQRRDLLARVYSIREHGDGSVEVNEVLSRPSNSPTEYIAYTQFEPRIQDSNGFIYLHGRHLDPPGLWKARLTRPYTPPEVSWATPTVFVTNEQYS